jgi:hypothetical protein
MNAESNEKKWAGAGNRAGNAVILRAAVAGRGCVACGGEGARNRTQISQIYQSYRLAIFMRKWPRTEETPNLPLLRERFYLTSTEWQNGRITSGSRYPGVGDRFTQADLWGPIPARISR